MFDNLKSGIFVRPKIEAWAARDDRWDLEHLGGELEREFNRQFNESRDQLVKSGELDIKKLESNLDRQSREMSGSLGEAASSLAKVPIQLGVAGLALNPLTGAFTWPAGLLFFGLAMNNTNNVVSQSSNFLGARAKRGETNRELRRGEKDLDEMESEFNGKSDTFQKAVANLDVRTHPQLQELHRLICEKAGVNWQPSTPGTDAGAAQEARPYLDNRDYRKKLPRSYRKLPDLV